MILTHDFLRASGQQTIFESSSDYRQRILFENNQLFSQKNTFDVFLSHSSLDHDEVINLIQLFNKCKYSVYVDWIFDKQLDRSYVTKDTAATLRLRMDQSKCLSFLATSNSTNSKWCPWELGYFDGKSQKSRCCILPILSYSAASYKGQEYLGLYPYLQYDQYLNSDAFDFWVHEQGSSKYITLKGWLSGMEPREH